MAEENPCNLCPERAEFMVEHEEFDPDEPPMFCAVHLGVGMKNHIDPGCGMEEITLLRSWRQS